MEFYLLFERKNIRLQQLLRSWYNPTNDHHRKLSKGASLEKISPNVYKFNNDPGLVRLICWLKMRERKNVKVLAAQELIDEEILMIPQLNNPV
jgi:hypothetical protein